MKQEGLKSSFLNRKSSFQQVAPRSIKQLMKMK